MSKKLNVKISSFKNLPEIPKTWLIALLLLGCIVLRGFGIDTFVTAALMAMVGYLTGVKLEQLRR